MIQESIGKQESIAGPPEGLNWCDLPGWKTIPYPATQPEISQTERAMRTYLRGCLAMYNDIKNPIPRYMVTHVQFERNAANPRTCTVTAFLTPGVIEVPPTANPEAGGGHLIPQEPTPPDNLG
jgi:hypothetical protein